jgi:hypothetical protein
VPGKGSRGINVYSGVTGALLVFLVAAGARQRRQVVASRPRDIWGPAHVRHDVPPNLRALDSIAAVLTRRVRVPLPSAFSLTSNSPHTGDRLDWRATKLGRFFVDVRLQAILAEEA